MQYVELAEVQEMAHDGAALVIDARPEIFHRLGHIPKALPLPRDDFETYFAKQRIILESKRAGMLLIYCRGNSCEDSDLVAKASLRMGSENVRIFRGGWTEWTKNGLPEEQS